MFVVIETISKVLSELIWPIFLPIFLLTSIYISFKCFFVIRPKLTKKHRIKPKHIIGPVSISLGAMIGTGAVIGVIASIPKMTVKGQVYFESMALWAIIAAVIMIPLCYSETMITKITKHPPHKYISILISKRAGELYAFLFIVLYLFGFGGFQFSGIDTALSVVNTKFVGTVLTEVERYFFIVVPCLIFVLSIVITKKHNLFINSLAYMIGIVVFLYCTFFVLFLIKTSDYIPIFLSRMVMGIKNPVSIGLGIPMGLMYGLLRVIQTSETGIGALGMASLDAKSKPREAAIISVVPTLVTVFIAIIITSYIASYGVSTDLMNVNSTTSYQRLLGFCDTALDVTGKFGFFVLIAFTFLSGVTTLLGSYYYLSILTNFGENTKIIIYAVLLLVAGILAIFGFTFVFEVVDVLLFVVAGINILALFTFVRNVK